MTAGSQVNVPTFTTRARYCNRAEWPVLTSLAAQKRTSCPTALLGPTTPIADPLVRAR